MDRWCSTVGDNMNGWVLPSASSFVGLALSLCAEDQISYLLGSLLSGNGVTGWANTRFPR
jgi:hypothetical protein